MQIDECRLKDAEEQFAPTTFLRFYQWDTPTVSLGRYQRPELGANLQYCQDNGIPVVRRPTGGRAVLHGRELTYSVVSNDRRFFPLHSLDLTYQGIARALQYGLGRLGITSQLAPGLRPTLRLSAGKAKLPCFASASRHELLVEGRKIAGSAQRRLRRSFLQHGSIPLEIDVEAMALALGVSEQLIAKTMISVSEAAGRPVSFNELAAALEEGFARLCGMGSRLRA